MMLLFQVSRTCGASSQKTIFNRFSRQSQAAPHPDDVFILKYYQQNLLKSTLIF